DPVRCPSRRLGARGGPPGRHLGVRAAQTSVGPPGRRRRARRRGGERRHRRRLQRPRGLLVDTERCRFQPADHPQRPAIRGRQSRCQPGPRLLRGRRGAGCGGGWSPLVGPAGRLHRSDHPLLTTAGNLLPGNRRASVETVAFARRNVVSRSAAICLLLLASAACRNNDPDPRFQQASAIYQQLYATQLDDAYADPRMDEVVALLGKVNPRSIDAERAQAMLRTIQKGRVELAKEQGTGVAGTVYRVAPSDVCRGKLPGLSGQIVLVVDGKIYRRTADPGPPPPSATAAAARSPAAGARPTPPPGGPPSAGAA